MNITVAERPILFSAPMVRALLAGRKTQTRRESIKSSRPGLVVPCDFDAEEAKLELENTHSGGRYWKPCPYGKPGDRLWVRENGWERPERTPKMMREGADTWEPYYYDADGITTSEAADFKAWGFKRRPSIFMPRWACRILLEVTRVRVEQLRTITRDDAIAEGIEGQSPNGPWRNYLRDCPGGYWFPEGRETAAIHSYTSLWESLNGAGSWYANPWVWVVEFRRA